jgi:transporter family-2 protein
VILQRSFYLNKELKGDLMPIAVWWIVALCAGLCSTLQSAVNGNITKTLGSYTAMACNFVMFILGTLLFLGYGIYLKEFSFSKMSSLRSNDYLGGVFGFGVVLLLTLCFPKLGALTTVALMILGQSIVAIVVDSQGLWGVPVVAISLQRILAIVLILSGVLLIKK